MKIKLVCESINEILQMKTKNDMFVLSDKSPEGTFLVGYVSASYDDLVKLFGEPNHIGDGYNISTMWVLEDTEGHVCTIYDWRFDKYSSHIRSIADLKNLDLYKWHIGSNDNRAANNLISYI